MPTENRSSNTEQMVSARVCAYTPGQSKVELQLIPPSALPSWLELGQQVIARPAAQHQADGYSAGDMADQGAKAFAARDPEVNELRAQLAEAQEVLRDCIEVGELDAETQWKAERVSKGRRLYVDDRALASIADPSEPVERDQGVPGTSFQRLNMLANQGE
ncbi:hypothetical protein KC131_24835 [Pseudomonas sp. JQ170]|uniref:hypothetical protein n=1 Tax=unclassified Pseudomonas TaxID=196821 RepID=UPI00264AB1CE|nr:MULTISPECIES: hypothetical protein [unclassified Pseudomonas]MDN7143875.1 hypothetical protein [Pseudomonas sp. JQ170]WRO74229.1 hypothetical protein U9R80_17065 [Pseudomonas sp. 170C]